MLKKTESPPDLVALDLWEDLLVIGSRILLLEKTLYIYLFRKNEVIPDKNKKRQM